MAITGLPSQNSAIGASAANARLVPTCTIASTSGSFVPPTVGRSGCSQNRVHATGSTPSARSDSVADGLQVYQRARMERTAKVVTESTAQAGIYQIADEAEMKRMFEQKNLAKERSLWLYNYDPLTVPLH